MSYRGPLPHHVVGRVNACALKLRSSPRWGALVSRYLTVLTYTGRRSGRTFSTPVGYRRTGDTVRIALQLPDAKTWWRNFVDEGGPVSLHLGGIDRTGHAVARRDKRHRVTVTVRLNA